MGRTACKQEHHGSLLPAAWGRKAQSTHMLLERGHMSLAFIFLFVEGPLEDEGEAHQVLKLLFPGHGSPCWEGWG